MEEHPSVQKQRNTMDCIEEEEEEEEEEEGEEEEEEEGEEEEEEEREGKEEEKLRIGVLPTLHKKEELEIETDRWSRTSRRGGDSRRKGG